MRRRLPLRPLRRIALLALLTACGSRTGLFGDDAPFAFGEDGGSVVSGREGGGDGGVAPVDADLIEDAADPPEDAPLPPIKPPPPRDASRVDCPPEETRIYLISSTDNLYSYAPLTRELRRIGKIDCAGGSYFAHPFSMAVDRKGTAYVLFNDGKLHRVSTRTAACSETSFAPGPEAGVFGMGFATNLTGTVDTLYVARPSLVEDPQTLASIDTTTFALKDIGVVRPVIREAELTGTGDGRLFGFYSRERGEDPLHYIGEIRQRDGRLVAETPMPGVKRGDGWAVAFWGGDFYMFTSPDDFGSVITRYRPADGSITQVGTIPNKIVGAGVSTCAPDH